MKILLVTNGYPPHRWAGTETYTAGIAEELSHRGNHVQVLCAGDWEIGDNGWNGFEDDKRNGVLVRRININWSKSPDPSRYLYNNPLIADFVTGYLDQVRPDIVHVTSCETLSASVLRVVKEAGLPLVLSLTDFWFLCPRINLLRSDGENCDGDTTAWDCLRCQLSHHKAYRWPRRMFSEQGTSRILTRVSKAPWLTRQRGLRGMASDMEDRKSFLRQALGWADFRITASRFVHDVFVANGIQFPIKIQSYGHDLSWMDRYFGKTPSKVIRFGFIGQIIPSKGVHFILEAASLLQNSFGDRFSLSIYGNLDKTPDYSTRLRSLAANAENIKFCGTYAHEDSANVFANLDVLVVPSLWYDFPLIIYEAFATQTPVIATNLGGMAEAVMHEATGLLFERGDVDDLARQLKRIVVEPGLLERLRSQAPPVRTIVEEVNELDAIYRKLTSHN